MATDTTTEAFEAFLARLRAQDAQAWATLVGHLRQVTVGWLYKRIGKLPAHALVSEHEFAQEVFAESLIKFYQLFQQGQFQQTSDLQSLMFKISELKLKEAFARLQKEALIYRPSSPEAFEAALKNQPDWSEQDDTARERALALQRHFGELPPADQEVLQRYYGGEKMSQMATRLGVTEGNLRKRKQRALERLKQLMQTAFKLFLLWHI